jgi:hypothetical protein
MNSIPEKVKPSFVGPGEGEALWFTGALATIKASGESTGGRVAVVDIWHRGATARPSTSTAAKTSGSTSWRGR